MRKAEFDRFAAEYLDMHAKSIRLSGEEPEYFARYKIADVKTEIAQVFGESLDLRILDFGSGIGASLPHFRSAFPSAKIVCADVSRQCLDLAQSRFPGEAEFVELTSNVLPFDDEAFDVVFTACVFHHIDHTEHLGLLSELLRVLKPGGMFFIFEHNPLNLLTVHAVNTCPYDANARLIGGQKMSRCLQAAGFANPRLVYRIFFPRPLAWLRPFERFMTKVPFGAQYYVVGRRNS